MPREWLMHSLVTPVALRDAGDDVGWGRLADSDCLSSAWVRPNELAALDDLVSVITPAHNGAWCIQQAVDCVARQTVRPLEHIIVDDGSSDATTEIVARLQAVHSHVTLVSQRRHGSAVARNHGIERARGRYIAFLDCDDLWRERKLERQIGHMERNSCLFTYGDYDQRNGRTGSIVARHEAPMSVGYDDFLRGCPVGCLTAAYNQETLGKFYMPAVRRGQDWGLWLRLTRTGCRAEKYPGNEAVYCCYPGSLSAHKLKKCGDIYRIYRTDEGMAVGAALQKLACHVFRSFDRRKQGRQRARISGDNVD